MKLKKIALVALTLGLVACEAPKDGGVAADSAPAKPSVQVDGGASGGDSSSSGGGQTQSSTVSITYHSLTKTFAPVNGFSFKTIQMTGSCVIFSAKTYCWDDGLKTIQFSSGGNNYGPYKYSYWGLGANHGPCWGGCTSDSMTEGSYVDGSLQANLNSSQANTGNSVNEVFNLGTTTQVDCDETSDKLTCGSLVIVK